MQCWRLSMRFFSSSVRVRRFVSRRRYIITLMSFERQEFYMFENSMGSLLQYISQLYIWMSVCVICGVNVALVWICIPYICSRTWQTYVVQHLHQSMNLCGYRRTDFCWAFIVWSVALRSLSTVINITTIKYFWSLISSSIT